MSMTTLGGIPFLQDYDPDISLDDQLQTWQQMYGNTQKPTLPSMPNYQNLINGNNPKKEYISPFVNSPTYKYEKDSHILGNKPVSLVSPSLGNDKYFFHYVFIPREDVGKMIKEYKEEKIDDHTINLYYEKSNPKKSNFFGTLVLIKMGDRFKVLIQDIINGVPHPIANYDKDTDKFLGKTQSLEDIIAYYQKIIGQSNNEEVDRSTIIFALSLSLTFNNQDNKGIFGFDERAAEWIKGLSKKLGDIKFTEKDYKPEEKKETKDKHITATDVARGIVDAEKVVAQALFNIIVPPPIQGFIKENVVDYVRKAIIGKLPPKMQIMIQDFIAKAQSILGFIATSLESLKDLAQETAKLLKAFLMGIANGFLSLLQFCIELIAWSVDNIIGKSLGMDLDQILSGERLLKSKERMEVLEDIYDFLSLNLHDFFEGIKNLIQTCTSHDLETLMQMLKGKVSKEIGEITRYDVAYFCGAFIFEVLFAVGITLLTGGAGLIAEAGNITAKAEQLLKIFVQETISTATLGIYDLFKLLKALFTKFITVAAKGFRNFVEYITELLTKKADDVIKDGEKILEDSTEKLRRLEDLLDDLGGRMLNEKDLKLLKQQLKEQYGVDLRLIDKEVGHQKLPITKNGKTEWVRSSELLEDWNKRRVVGKFHEGPPPVMILRSNNASELTVFHEKVHLEVWFNKLPPMHIVDEEKLVFEEIFKVKDKYGWTNDELIDAYDYVNKRVIKPFNDAGKNFPKLQNEFIEQLKINKLLNVK